MPEPSPTTPPDFNILPESGSSTPWQVDPPAATSQRDTPDRGTPRSRIIATIAAVLAILAVMTTQQIGAFQSEKPATQEAGTAIQPPQEGDSFLMMSGILVRVANVLKSMSPNNRLDSMNAGTLITQVEEAAATPEDHFRALVVAAEIGGLEGTDERIDRALKDKRIEYPGSQEDVDALRAITAGHTPSPEQQASLRERHGYFGRLALTLGKPDTDPARAPYTRGGAAIMGFFVAVGGLLLAVGAASLVCFVIMIVRLSAGKVRPAFVPPAPGGSVYLEMVALMAGSFLFLQVVLGVLGAKMFSKEHPPTEAFKIFSLSCHWLLVATLFWPVLRGTPWKEHRQRLGWTSGKGVLREAGAGVFAYLSSLPLLIGAMVITALLVMAYDLISKQMGHDAGPPQNEIAELLGTGSPALLAMLFVLATVWAPLVEEAIFRGALFRHLRSRWGMWAAALVSALAFGSMHGYMVFLLLPVITLGFVFALMREWRGSLIASMVVHGLHNGTVLVLAITLFSLLRPE